MKDEHGESFDCFGGTCAAYVIGEHADAAVAHAKRRLLGWHDHFTRFDPMSELSRLNADRRDAVPVSFLLARLAQTAVGAAELTGGLVDATLLGELEQAGYRSDLGEPVPLAEALRLAPSRARAAGREGAPWRALSVDGRIVRRPPGMKLDGGGLAKGLFADALACELTGYRGFAIDCAGDLRVGGLARRVSVDDPFGRGALATLRIADGAIATSGISRRSWIDDAGRPAHHLLDPSTGAPAFTGIVQATAVAPTAVEAEIRAKAALLSGPERAPAWLPHGGVLVFDDGSTQHCRGDQPVPHRRLRRAA
ncbi:MAG TPA: FAD:protein FMN transferase [Solirubrobacteraceae bacterium]|nr:FAD:protein FMN transferase [Solirubrobacteraceae bacterium]